MLVSSGDDGLPSSTAASDDSAVIPQELIDIIVSGVNDRQSLKACSLVSRRFCSPAQKRLFESFRLSPTTTAPQYRLGLAAFDSLQAGSPHISRNVRRLTIACPWEGHRYNAPDWMTYEPFSRVLDRFEHLTELVLESSGSPGVTALPWWKLSPSAKSALTRAFSQPTVVSMSFRSVYFGSHRELRNAFLLPHKTHLSSLSLCAVGFGPSELIDELDPTPQEQSDKLLLRDSLLLQTEESAFVKSLGKLVDVCVLQHMEFTIQTKDCEEVAQAAFVRPARNLKSLTIVLEHELTDTSELSLSHMLHLDTLTIKFELLSELKPDNYRPGQWVSRLVAPPSPNAHSPDSLSRFSLMSTLSPLVPVFRSWVEGAFTPQLTIRLVTEDFYFAIDEMGAGVENDVFELVGSLGLHTEVELVQY
ncbi:hypothetical protein MIND_00182000 [Mycena indigotica]|uniref:F-box domain-containing protein n=1 Tax=Mycena indigotica TaxID=2126181 RepID=A0A8H6T696_9AGAR|nr:uncharacterized protein MIND_00182000 [Mycena indigotica]KAF7311721.1 hypothetical protein MIND_00182000 [Mycena indigotica]